MPKIDCNLSQLLFGRAEYLCLSYSSYVASLKHPTHCMVHMRSSLNTCQTSEEFDKPLTLTTAPSRRLFSSRGGNSPVLLLCMFSLRRAQNSLSHPEIPSLHAPPTSRPLTPPVGGPSVLGPGWIDPLPRGVSTPGWPLPTRLTHLAAGSSQHLPE